MKKRILLGVTGGIAAYKAADLLRKLMGPGLDVQVAMTPAATQFVTPMTFQALSGHPVATQLFDGNQEHTMAHIELASAADGVVVAPASADFLARLAAGMGDDLLSTLLLVAKCPVVLAPAMNCNMWANPLVQANVERLAKLAGYRIVGPGMGELACGDQGAGRLVEVDHIVEETLSAVGSRQLEGVHVLVNAGPTHEVIDPVRYLGNRSSGKMGYCIAKEARRRGARVTLVSGPVGLLPPYGVDLVRVETASQMYQATMEHAQGASLAVLSAAVADWSPLRVSGQKIKKNEVKGGVPSLELKINGDILKDLCQSKGRPPVVVGFAAETAEDNQVLTRLGSEKLAHKGCDLMVVNPVGVEGMGFGAEMNRALLIDRHNANSPVHSGVVSKELLACQILDHILPWIELRHSAGGGVGNNG